ncbi:uro-adherence factor A-like [Penaeus japonicus]|uniref:uro-adherence factor A-like n=1 Tax=Penaeus japonicus TaxID=27405 RepID=UPI001C715772|nr:uro-adherence factor A-like [Penaeus japonicus]
MGEVQVLVAQPQESLFKKTLQPSESGNQWEEVWQENRAISEELSEESHLDLSMSVQISDVGGDEDSKRVGQEIELLEESQARVKWPERNLERRQGCWKLNLDVKRRRLNNCEKNNIDVKEMEKTNQKKDTDVAYRSLRNEENKLPKESHRHRRAARRRRTASLGWEYLLRKRESARVSQRESARVSESQSQSARDSESQSARVSQSQRESKRDSESQRESARASESQRESTRVSENQRESTRDSQSQSARVSDIQRESESVSESQPESERVSENQRESVSESRFSWYLKEKSVQLHRIMMMVALSIR